MNDIQMNQDLIPQGNESVSGKIGSPEAPFLIDLFYRLGRERIDYCVLRNYEKLPASLGWSDIDILIKETELSDFISLIKASSRNLGGYLISQYKMSTFQRFCFCGHIDIGWWGVQFDIHTDETYYGIPYYDKNELLARCQSKQGISVCNINDSQILSLLKESLSNGTSRKNYALKAAKAFNNNQTYYYQQFKNFFEKKSASRWKTYFEGALNEAELKMISQLSRRSLFIKSIKKSPLKTINQVLRFYLDRLFRIFNRPGFVISLIGVDGSGKSTIIEGIRIPLESALHSKICCEHLRPNLLPSIAQLFDRPISSGPVTEPHKSKPSGFVGSIFRLLYYTLDYILGYWIKVFPEIVRRPRLFVFDRYFYDYFFDQRRSRVSLPIWIIKLFSLIIPKPDLVLCLGTEPEIINARKPELPLEEIKRQVEILKQFCKKTRNAVWIDTGNPVNQSIDDVLTAIVTRMAARYGQT